jgi:Domain of unknown function (DUF6089)
MRFTLIFFFTSFFFFKINAQGLDAFEHKGEIGLSIGVGNYFGDINNQASFANPKFAAGIFYKKYINNYVAVKLSGNYAFLGASDINSKNQVQKIRNLSFNTNVWDVSINGEFNFFKFYPGNEIYRFTPYVSLGVGVMSFDPYAFYNGEKIFLRSIGTEGQGSTAYPNLNQYGATALIVPLGIGIKYNLNPKINVFAEISYRFAGTDFLDDVSGNYAPDAFPPDANGNPSLGFLLQDRSYEYGVTLGTKGKQRGTSLQKDSYATFQIGISFNIDNYRCPKY